MEEWVDSAIGRYAVSAAGSTAVSGHDADGGSRSGGVGRPPTDRVVFVSPSVGLATRHEPVTNGREDCSDPVDDRVGPRARRECCRGVGGLGGVTLVEQPLVPLDDRASVGCLRLDVLAQGLVLRFQLGDALVFAGDGDVVFASWDDG
jgi:hypothetical protein